MAYDMTLVEVLHNENKTAEMDVKGKGKKVECQIKKNNALVVSIPQILRRLVLVAFYTDFGIGRALSHTVFCGFGFGFGAVGGIAGVWSVASYEHGMS
jgi:hypothetical protein